MDDSISRKTVLEMIPKYVSDALDERTLCYDIEHLPSAQIKGHWVTTKSIDNEYFQMCDVCQRMASVRTNFCPNCGADMRES